MRAREDRRFLTHYALVNIVTRHPGQQYYLRAHQCYKLALPAELDVKTQIKYVAVRVLGTVPAIMDNSFRRMSFILT